MNDLVLKLRELRRVARVTQRELADMSGVGEKSISSFETGIRIERIKLAQVHAIVSACGMTLAEFFAWDVETEPVLRPPVEVRAHHCDCSSHVCTQRVVRRNGRCASCSEYCRRAA